MSKPKTLLWAQPVESSFSMEKTVPEPNHSISRTSGPLRDPCHQTSPHGQGQDMERPQGRLGLKSVTRTREGPGPRPQRDGHERSQVVTSKGLNCCVTRRRSDFRLQSILFLIYEYKNGALEKPIFPLQQCAKPMS